MFSSKDLKKWIERVYCPCALVASAKSAESICLDCGLTFINMITPFLDIKNVNAPLRSSTSSFTIKGFKVQLTDLRQFKALDNEDIEANIKDFLLNNQPPKEAITKLIHKNSGMLPIELTEEAWYPKFREELNKNLKYHEFDMIDHPVGAFVAVGSGESDPIKKFDDLAQKVIGMKQFQSGLYESNIPIFYVLVHDNCTDIDAKDILRKMKSKFNASNCKLITINSIPTEESHGILEEWKDYTSPPKSNGKVPGCRMNQSDLDSIQEAMVSIIKRGIIPNIEKRCYQYNNDIAAERKGLRNAFKSWLRTPKANEGGKNSIMYDKDSTEFKIRVLGDLAFMVHDYNTAIENYRMIIEDYKADSSYNYLANAMEMLLLSELITSGPQRDTMETIDTIATYYKKGKDKCSNHFISRVYFLASDYQNCRDFYKGEMQKYKPNVGPFLVKASSSESSEFAAMLLDQAGKCFSDIESKRAYFQYIMAGHIYGKLGITGHTIRCYYMALQEFAQKGWQFIENHIYRTLQSKVSVYESPENSLPFYNNFIACEYQSQEIQHQIMDEFWSTISSISKDNNNHNNNNNNNSLFLQQLPLPLIDMNSLRILIKDNASSDILIPLNGSLKYAQGWSNLYSTVSYSRLNVRSIMGNTNDTQGNITKLVCGQPYIVEFYIQNPLDLPLQIDNMKLNIINNNEEINIENIDDYVQSEKLSFLLSPKETKLITLHINALKAGLFRVQSIRWTLNNEKGELIDVDYTLEIKGKKLHATHEQRSTGARRIERCLELEIQDDQAYLGFDIENSKSTIYKNEILPLKFKLVNKGIVNIDKVILFTDLNSFYHNQTGFKDIQSITPSPASPIDIDEEVNFFSLIKNNTMLLPNETFSDDCYIHIPSTNKLNVKFLVLYCGEDQVFKVLRYEMNFICNPLLSATNNVIPHPIDKTTEIIQTIYENHSDSIAIKNIYTTSRSPNYMFSSFLPSNPISLLPSQQISTFMNVCLQQNNENILQLPSLYKQFMNDFKIDFKSTSLSEEYYVNSTNDSQSHHENLVIDSVWELEDGSCGLVFNQPQLTIE
ncbi:hypothetical protein WA158_003450 [Blastocystis sp. Blastoise]